MTDCGMRCRRSARVHAETDMSQVRVRGHAGWASLRSERSPRPFPPVPQTVGTPLLTYTMPRGKKRANKAHSRLAEPLKPEMSVAEQEHIRSRVKSKTVIQKTFDQIGTIVQTAVNTTGGCEAGNRLYEAYQSWRKQTEDHLQENARQNKRRHRWGLLKANAVQYQLQSLRAELTKKQHDPAALAILLVSRHKNHALVDTVSDDACPSRTQSLQTIELCGAASAQPILAQMVA
jgi:hypothetical protein